MSKSGRLTFARVDDGQANEGSHADGREHDEEGYAFVLIKFAFQKRKIYRNTVYFLEQL